MINTNQTQEDRVINYIKENRTITQQHATIQLSISRLAARIYTLIKRGYPIDKKIITVKNKFGEKCHVAEYYLKEDSND